jgi:hypothetical protein
VLTFMSLTTCWKRPPRAAHSLNINKVIQYEYGE